MPSRTSLDHSLHWDFGRSSLFVMRPTASGSCSSSSSLYATVDSSNVEMDGEKFDALISNTDNFGEAVRFIQSHPGLEMTRDRFQRIFDAIEEITRTAEEQSINTRMEQVALPMLSSSRTQMSDMYTALKEAGHLRLFGGITRDNLPAAGSHTVRPSLLEQITLLSMKSLTPRPSNTLLYAGVAVATLEAIASVTVGWDLNFLFFLTLTAALADRVLLNGAVSETCVKILSPETQPKITRHEAGHFLCAYLLGAPLEGYVLSAFAALQDPRFGSRGVSAGTSFFDQDLSNQISKSEIKRSAVDRYSVIVMAGIAAEAVTYNQADGGAGDETALINFLLSLSGDWNDFTIRNQARWGALQAILLLREYKECYDALVDAMERGGSLADCIYAIENTARKLDKAPLKRPVGFIIEQADGLEEAWVTELPTQTTASSETESKNIQASKDPEDSLKSLRSTLTLKLSDIDSKLDELDKTQ